MGSILKNVREGVKAAGKCEHLHIEFYVKLFGHASDIAFRKLIQFLELEQYQIDPLNTTPANSTQPLDMPATFYDSFSPYLKSE